jgi:hypothetical protein
MAWIFVPAERVKAMTADEANAALKAVITARHRALSVMRAVGPLLALASIAAIALVSRMVTADNLGFGPNR